MSGRVDSFAILTQPSAIPTKPKLEKRVDEGAIAERARAEGFPSRQPPKPTALAKRQQCRNRHLGIKATDEAAKRFYKIAGARNLRHGELLRLALHALQRAGV